MNAERRLILFVTTAAALAGAAVLGSACFVKDPCGAGLVENPNSGNCQAPPPPVPEGGTGDGGDVDAAPASDIGKACQKTEDCGPTAPQCGAPQLPYCTQIECKEGQANAGICPTGFTCQEFPGFPSFCMKN